jgi:pyruvate dehydrogenase E1 component alpha subunit
LIEAVTYRIRGHYVGDPEATYRTPEEVVEARKREPLVRTREKLVAAGTDPAELEAMEKSIAEKLANLEKWALQQEFPTLESAVDHVGIALEHAPETRGPLAAAR